ncbi:MAG: hypothetical protein ACRENT_00950 [Thermodesulfobacteriota bacterium]
MVSKTALILFTLLFSFPSDIEVSILSKGFSAQPSKLENMVIKNEAELKRVWKELEIGEEVPVVDFHKEQVIVLLSKGKLGSSLEISRVERSSNDAVDVIFVVKPISSPTTKKRSQMFPYLVAKLYPMDVVKARVKFIEDTPLPPVPAGTGIGQIPSYTSVLKQYDGAAMFQFFPLDKENVWTYTIESKEKAKEETYSVRSISQDGWSVFDNFFGQKDIGIRIDSNGNISVSSGNGVADFYTQQIQREFKKSAFSTPAGKFNDLMVVSVPENGGFWFKDIYAKGVGLIFHEHRSPKGTAKYTLVRAVVKGENYPKSGSK